MLTPISESELSIMKYLWSEMEEGRQQKSFADILDQTKESEDKEWKKQTVNTFLSRLRKKELIEIIHTEKYSLYRPVVSRQEYLRLFLEGLLPEEKGNKRFQRFLLNLTRDKLTNKDKATLLKQVERL